MELNYFPLLQMNQRLMREKQLEEARRRAELEHYHRRMKQEYERQLEEARYRDELERYYRMKQEQEVKRRLQYKERKRRAELERYQRLKEEEEERRKHEELRMLQKGEEELRRQRALDAQRLRRSRETQSRHDVRGPGGSLRGHIPSSDKRLNHGALVETHVSQSDKDPQEISESQSQSEIPVSEVKSKKSLKPQHRREKIVVEDVTDSEIEEEELASVWRNRRPSPGQWLEPVDNYVVVAENE